jgi:hypothetical protein
LSGLIEEMVGRYDVDGVHLDFIRYPGKNFDDKFSYSAYGNGIPIDEWRRDNITRLVELIHRKVKSKKPFVKIGAAPIGIYKNLPGMNGWESFNDIYQDTHEWLRRGLLDYAAPQIYWSLNDKTRFDLLAKDWIEKSYGRNIILGIAAYKEDVKEQIENMIHLSRQLNAAGVAFFRYSSIKEYSFGSFNHKTFPALMPWLDGFAPAPPGELIASTLAGKNRFRLEWKTDETGRIDSTRYFAIYSLPSPVDEPQPDYLFDIVPADKNYVTIGFDKPKKINYYFALKSVSKLWKESEEASNVAVVKIPELASLASFFNYKMNPALVNNGRALLISSQIEDRVFISGIERSGGAPVPIAEALLKPGKNIIELFIPLEKYRSLSLLFDSSSRKMNLNLP